MRGRRRGRRRPWVLLTCLVASNVIFGLTATNFVPVSIAGTHQQPITANDLKPPECSALNLTRVVGGSLVVEGNSENDLVLGSDVVDLLDGREGDDCVVAGPGDDSLTGGLGTDVCIGGGGNDTFLGCETEIQ